MEELQVFSDESISDIRILSVKEVISYNSAKILMRVVKNALRH